MKPQRTVHDPAGWIRGVVQGFLDQSPENSLKGAPEEKAWEDALVGFARGDDPIFEAFKEHVGPFHWTPEEIFHQAFPGHVVRPEELTVIAWVLPQREATKADNRRETVYPSQRWARARIFGEEVNVKLRQAVVAALEGAGHPAVSPMLSPLWTRKDHPRYTFSSTWSERHAAHACGLGTFGLCDGLITPAGKAMRVGSVVAGIRIPPSPRPYSDHRAYCLFFSHGICGKCIPRCPVGALSEAGHDKIKCEAHLTLATRGYVRAQYGFEGYGCGLCQTKVPCESRIPGVRDAGASEAQPDP
jgi:epoxyqueuosine reductase QueG